MKRAGGGEVARSPARAAGQQDRRGRLQAVEHQGRGGEALAPGPQHIGRADIARADVAHVALAGEPGQQQPERDRPEQIAEQPERRAVRRSSGGRGSKSSDPATIAIAIAAALQTARCYMTHARWTRPRPSAVLRFRRRRAVGAAADPRAAAQCADRLCRRQRRLSLWQAQRGRDRGARAGPARPAGRALPPAPRRDRLQHRLDHRARPRPRRARPAGRRHGPGDQARGGNVEDAA